MAACIDKEFIEPTVLNRLPVLQVDKPAYQNFGIKHQSIGDGPP